MTLLEIVNSILPAMGENPVSSLDSRNPTVGMILTAIDYKRRELLSRGWWFNRVKIEVVPDVRGVYKLPDNALQWTYEEVPSILQGKVLLNPENSLTSVFEGVGNIKGEIVCDVEFDDLPNSFKNWLAVAAKISVYVSDIGTGGVLEIWQADAYRLEALVMNEHVRNLNYSTAKSRRFRRIQSAIWR